MPRAKTENETQRHISVNKPFCAVEPAEFPCVTGVRALPRRQQSARDSGLRCLGLEHMSAHCLPPHRLQRWRN
jgi:hypothetical protein